ncbi:hypothetical protein [Noviherbaspirillum saxi]|nr:hypothetical protein [Noviherbaspirillum saxi]
MTVWLHLPTNATHNEISSPALLNNTGIPIERPMPDARQATVQPSPSELAAPSLTSPMVSDTVAEERLAPALLEIPEPPYLEISQLTEKPDLIEDIPADKVKQVTDVPVEPVIANLLINEAGGIDNVVINDPALSEEIRQFIVDSFAGVRFHPGKVGALPVKSQMAIEIRLDPPKPAPAPVPVIVRTLQ